MREKRTSTGLNTDWPGLITLASSLLISVGLGMLLKILFRKSNGQISMTTPADYVTAVHEYLLREWFCENMAVYITAQACFETSVNGIPFQSNVFLNTRNCFGFKYSGHPLEIGNYKDYGVYETVADCVKRYADYYVKMHYPANFASVDDFVKALKSKGYFEGDLNEYTNGVKKYTREYFNISGDPISGAGASW